jgi:hypothetical protein
MNFYACIPTPKVAPAWGLPGSNQWPSDDAPSWERPDAVTQLPQDLDHLFGFKLGTKAIIRIWHTNVLKGSLVDHQRDMCAVVTPIIFPTLERVWEAGYHTNMILSGQEEIAAPNDVVLEGKPASVDVWNKSIQEGE